MEPERKPEVVDLARYKQAAEAAAKRKAAVAPPPRPTREPLLGSRPRAGLIFLLAVIAIAAFWALSNLR